MSLWYRDCLVYERSWNQFPILNINSNNKWVNKYIRNYYWVWCLKTVIPAPGRLRQEDCYKFQTSLCLKKVPPKKNSKKLRGTKKWRLIS